jgi:hypothetical protein
VSIEWDNLPDRPDGQIDYAVGGNKPVAGQPRRSIPFGNVILAEREITLRIQRVQVDNQAPI